MIDKDAVLARLDIRREFETLLPVGKGTTRQCPNTEAHSAGDRNPSLSFNPTNGGWKCHGCGMSGDLFRLHEIVHKKSFAEVLTELAKSVGIEEKKTGIPENHKDFTAYLLCGAMPKEIESFLWNRYRVPIEIVTKYGLKWDSRTSRLLIPIHDNHGNLVNIKKHDITRHYASFEDSQGSPVERPSLSAIEMQTTTAIPKWNGRSGKTMSVSGFGSNRLYPMKDIKQLGKGKYLIVGGELKALALRGLGVPAFSFTTGEGAINDKDLALIKEATPVVLMDPDEAGVRAARQMAEKLKCDYYTWRDDVVSDLPPKGDITDVIIKLGAAWESALDVVYYQHEEAAHTPEPDRPELIKFGDLLDPNLIGQTVSVEAIVSGKSEIPFVVPSKVVAECRMGQAVKSEHCGRCILPKCGFKLTHQLNLTQVIKLAGLPPDKSKEAALQIAGIAPKCGMPKVDIENVAVDPIVVSPTIKYEEEVQSVRNHPIWVVDSNVIRTADSAAYRFTGQMIPDPAHGRFMLAANQYERTDNDALSFTRKTHIEDELKKILQGKPADAVKSLVKMMREHVAHIYGQDDMLISILLAMFMPFQFYIGPQICERICPQVCIIGDTNVGKSTACKSLIRHFGSGRFHDAGSNPTFAGLIGGNMTLPNKQQVFTWGVFPQTHRAFLALDEWNKMSPFDIGKLTNTLTSGRAERVTVGSAGKAAACHVRLLTLANMRDNFRNKRLSQVNIGKELDKLYGTPQDLGRVEFVHVQHTLDDDVYNTIRQPTCSMEYVKEIAEYHLSWAWNLNKESIKFQDINVLLDKASRLGQTYGNHPLLLKQQVRWKLARVAAGFAALTFSDNNGELLVTNDHCELASQWLMKKGKESQ